MNKKELEELIAEGFISQETAQRIDTYYKQKKEKQKNNLPSLIISILGIILVGLGGILIVAYNWDELPRFAKLIIALAILIVGQIACAYTLIKKRDSKAWAESSASFLLFAIGSCIAVVAQVYNISSVSGNFMLTWFLLSMPLMYVMRSSTVLILCIGLATYYVGETHSWLYLLLIGTTLPYYYSLLKKGNSHAAYFVNWLLPISLLTAVSFVFNMGWWKFDLMIYMSVLGLLFQLGYNSLLKGQTLGNGFKALPLMNALIILPMSTFRFYWDEHFFRSEKTIFIAVMSVATLALYAYGAYGQKSKPLFRGNPTGLILVVFILLNILMAYGYFSSELFPMVLMNLLTFLLALYYIYVGNKEINLIKMNYGLILMAILIGCRFFDSNMPILIRGLAFLALGVILILSNKYMHKKRKDHAQS